MKTLPLASDHLSTRSFLPVERLIRAIISSQSAAPKARESHNVGLLGVMISKREKCTLSKTGGRADVLMCLHKRIEEKSFEVREGFSLCEIFTGDYCITNTHLALQANLSA